MMKPIGEKDLEDRGLRRRATGLAAMDAPERSSRVPDLPRPSIPTERATTMSDLIDAMQWPAMVVTVAASWLVGSTHRRRRSVGFWLFIASNILWVAWGWHGGAPALVVLQVCLAAMNVRGMLKARAANA
jgi:hypothetical protein